MRRSNRETPTSWIELRRCMEYDISTTHIGFGGLYEKIFFVINICVFGSNYLLEIGMSRYKHL